jgi:hypothetical protein
LLDASLPPNIAGSAKLTGERFDLYRQIVGSLLYAANVTRIDVCFTVGQLCRFSASPCEYHLSVAYSVLLYLNAHSELGLEFGRSTGNPIPSITTYSDADWAGDKTDRKSTSGGIVKFNGDVVKWISKKQQCVSLSSLESEYISIGEGVKETKWCLSWIKEVLGNEIKAKLWCDNEAAINLTANDAVHDRSKHIDIKYHFIRDNWVKKIISIHWVSTKQQWADILTKCLDPGIHGNLRSVLMSKAVSS